VKYNKNFTYLFIYTFFLELTYRSDPSKDFHACGSNDADSHKDVPFGGLVHIAPRFGGETPKNNFWGVDRRFQAKRAKY